MPLQLNVGLSRKVGLPDYGSLGASCHVEVELDASLLREDPTGFQRHVRHAFQLCRDAVDSELERSRHDPVTSSTAAHTNGNGYQAPANGRTAGRLATTSQVRALHAIAQRQRLDLTGEIRNRFQVDRPDDLSVGQASELIDALNQNGHVAEPSR